MRIARCPAAVIRSCRTVHQLMVAERYMRMWLERHGHPRASMAGFLLWKTYETRLFTLLCLHGVPRR